MATLLAVAMIGQNTVMTTAENYVADNTAVVAEEQAQEPEVQVEESASPAVQESARFAGIGDRQWQKHQRNRRRRQWQRHQRNRQRRQWQKPPAEPVAGRNTSGTGGAGSGRNASGTGWSDSGRDTSGTGGSDSGRNARDSG